MLETFAPITLAGLVDNGGFAVSEIGEAKTRTQQTILSPQPTPSILGKKGAHGYFVDALCLKDREQFQ